MVFTEKERNTVLMILLSIIGLNHSHTHKATVQKIATCFEETGRIKDDTRTGSPITLDVIKLCFVEDPLHPHAEVHKYIM